MQHFAQQIVAFITEHAVWAGPIMGLLTFLESLAFVGLFFPTTFLLVAVGTLIQKGVLSFWAIALFSIPGAALGDSVSYWVGKRFGDKLVTRWPFKARPDLVAKGELFFRKHGAISIALCRFLGPLRAIVPLTAGMLHMPQRSFQFANITSAILWVPVMLLPGVIGGWVWSALEHSDSPELKLLLGGVVVLAIGGFIWYRLRRGPKPDAQAEMDATVAELDEYREHRRRNDAA